jgi:thioredoxin reductase (NADPH)
MSQSVAIIGSGPAGLTAAIYAARAHLVPTVFEGSQAGGQLMLTSEVENYPGFPEGITGPQIMDSFRKQAERFGTRLIAEDVTKVDFSAPPFAVWGDEEEHRVAAVIVATGAEARWLGLSAEERFRGRGVSACATCDGFFFRGKDVVVVGGGDTAMEEALFLTKFAPKVTIVHRRSELRASWIMARRVLDNPAITIRWDSVVEDILGDTRVSGVRLRNVQTSKTEDLPAEGVFVAIGHKPATAIFEGQLELDNRGYVRTSEGSATSVEGVFAAGDVVDSTYRQAVTAAGMGCQAAMDAARWLHSRESQSAHRG